MKSVDLLKAEKNRAASVRRPGASLHGSECRRLRSGGDYTWVAVRAPPASQVEICRRSLQISTHKPWPSRQSHFLADLYSFQWSAFSFRLPLVSASAVALCLFVGILAGHPGGGLIAGGGAFTIGFGANQRIADSRLIPMLVAVFGCSTATLAGTIAGHKDYLAGDRGQHLSVHLRSAYDAQRRPVVGGSTGFRRVARCFRFSHAAWPRARSRRADRGRRDRPGPVYFRRAQPDSRSSQGPSLHRNFGGKQRPGAGPGRTDGADPRACADPCTR